MKSETWGDLADPPRIGTSCEVARGEPRRREAFPAHLLPDLGYVVVLHAGLPDRLDLRLQRVLAAARAQWLSLAAAVVCSRFARLDSAGHLPPAVSHFCRKHF
ncbi:hypothetical protein [Burkholderia anthina]|uniref:hypothetical protein n=1 Tax=Burkholderia anthina TaxID=179879 RepID=UPI001589FA65|nr:hypothetical protein [Burkholderia anthina]